MAQNVCGVTSWCKPKEVPKKTRHDKRQQTQKQGEGEGGAG